VWKHQARSLAALAAVEVIDYGPSASLERMAQVAIERASGRFAVAGHSMGGRVAFEIMRQAPERVAGLAVLDTAYRGMPAGEAGKREKAERNELLEVALSKGMRAMALHWMRRIIDPSRLSDEPLTSSIVEMMSRKSTETYAAQVQALLTRPDATPFLSTIRCPAIVLCGRGDKVSPLSGHREMAALIPRSKLVVIEKCGHMSTMERQDEVTSAMTEWLKGVDS
jgi:pimeloyl-ACP methyl ester carboxylesterase